MRCTLNLVDFWLLEAGVKHLLEPTIRDYCDTCGDSLNLVPLPGDLWKGTVDSAVKLARLGLIPLEPGNAVESLDAEQIARDLTLDRQFKHPFASHLTDLGGRVWESISRPDWDQYNEGWASEGETIEGEIADHEACWYLQAMFCHNVLVAGTRQAAEDWLKWSFNADCLIDVPERLLFCSTVRNWRPMKWSTPRDAWLGVYRTSGAPRAGHGDCCEEYVEHEYPLWREFGTTAGCRHEINDPDWTASVDV